jgi:hypothetical protein
MCGMMQVNGVDDEVESDGREGAMTSIDGGGC